MWDKNWLQQFPKVTFAAKEKIFTMGETIQYNYYLIDGICARINPTIDGEDIILQYHQPGKMLGLHLRQFGYETTLDFVAKTDCTCYKIPWKLVDEQVRTNNALCYSLMEELVNDCEFWSVSYVAYTLGGGISVLALALKMSSVLQADGHYWLHPMFTNVELSKFCGIHTVSISRLMTKLTHEGILERKKEGIVIYDMERLSAYVKLGE